MELPFPLKAAIERLVADRSQAELRRAGETLSKRYRAETRDGRLHLSDDLTAQAYAAARMPATYAAIRECLAQISAARPDLSPRGLLDVGAGPGTALWAAQDAFGIEEALLLEASDPIRRVGERLWEGVFDFAPRYEAVDAVKGLGGAPSADLVTLAYVLDEVDPGHVPRLVDDLWAATRQLLLIVEPGTPAGWRRILQVRRRLIVAGGHLVAPCPHALDCPVVEPDWCHFARRLPRSKLHRQIKGGEAPFEDEKFAYVAVARSSGELPQARVLTSPREASGRVALKLCRDDGSLAEHLVTRRDGADYKRAKRRGWGDSW